MLTFYFIFWRKKYSWGCSFAATDDVLCRYCWCIAVVHRIFLFSLFSLFWVFDVPSRSQMCICLSCNWTLWAERSTRRDRCRCLCKQSALVKLFSTMCHLNVRHHKITIEKRLVNINSSQLDYECLVLLEFP